VTSDDPVILNSGDFFESEIDLAVPGRGLDWSFQRTYRSQSRVRTSMGFGWVHNAMQALAVDGDTAQFRTATGARLWLKKTSDGLFQSESGVRLRVTDAERVVRDVDGTLYTFRPAPAAPTQSYLVSIEDARGNRLRFTTDLFGRVVAVADSLGRVAHYRYDLATGLLAEVAAPDGRRVAFRYDGHGDLVRVSRFAPSADAPYSETAYAYSSGQQQPDLNHNLTHIWLPGDIGANQPSVEIRYGADPGTDTFDRVVWQRSGAVVETFSYRTVDAPAGRLFETRVAAEGRATSVHAFADGAREVRRHLEAADGTRIGIENEYDPKGRLVRETSPEGNGVLYRRDSEGRTVEVHEVPRPGSPLPPRVFVYRYEPLYGRLKAAYGPFAGSAPTDPRELERRLIVRNDFDYEEATALPPSLAAFGVDVKPAGLGDLNGDGRADGAAGLVVRSTRPAEPGAMGGGSAALETRYVYREGGLPLRATGPDGSVREFEYRAAGTERAGYLHRVSVRHADGVRREIARYDWDEFGRLVGVTDRDGRRVGIVNDSLGRAIMIVPADPGLPRQRLAYDPQGRIVGEWRLTEDERRSGKPGAPVAEYRFDAFGKMLSYRLWADGGAPIERQYVHDRGGRLAAIVAGNRRWERTLDPFGRTVREGIPGAGGFARTFAYDRNGNVTADTDGDGNRSEYRYDGFDRLAEIVRPDGSSVKFGLDLADRMVERRILGRARDGAPSAALRIDGVDYPDDARGQATALWVGSERDGKLVKRIVARATYDRFGRATGMTLLDRPTPVELTVRRDAAGAVASIDDASGPLVGLLRDRLGRPATLQLASAAGATQPLALLSRDYHEGADGVVLPGGGRIVESTIAEPGAGRIERRALDAGGREAARTTVALDRIGRPIRVTSQRPHVADRPVTVLDRVLRWDEFSRLAEVKDGNGTLARLEYDASGRLASWSHFGLDPRRRTYAEHGSDSTVDALGNRTETRRDGMGRIVAMSHFGRDATTPEIERRFEFDGLGRLAGHSNAAWQVERRFADDGAAREDLHADRQDGRRFAVASRFDPYGRLSSYRYPSGLEVSYEWRTENEVRIRTAGIELTVRYDDAGRIAGVATDRAEVRYERSAPNPGIELRATRVLAAGREALVQADRFRDGVLESRRAEPGGLDSRYRRDPQGRLIAGSSFVADGAAAPRPVEFRYGFDGRGNRAFETLGAETTAYEARAGYGPARVGADAVRYDAAGAVVAIGAETYTHDASGRLAAYRDAARGIELRYRRDAEGRVVRREAPGDVRVYVHGDAGLLAEYRNEAVRAEYVYDGSGQLLAVVTEGKAALAATGPDGSLLALIDPDGAIRERHYHGAYGATSVRDAAGRPVDSPRSALSFAGMMYDAAARLYVTPTRTLAPRIGGFLSPEPLGPFAADHPYAYAMDDPLSFTDRSGLQADAVTGGTDANVGLARQAVKPVTDLYERSTGALNQAFGEEKPRESGSGGGAPASPSGTSPGLSHERTALPASRDYAAEARRDEAARRSAELRAREAAEQKRSARNRAYARTVLPDTVVANWLDERNWHRLRYPRDYRPRPGESPWHPFHGPSAVDPPGVPSDLLRQGLANSPVARDPERELRQILDRYLAGRPANLAVPTPGQGGTTTDAAASTQMPGEGGGRPPPQTQQPGGAAGVFGQFGQDIQTSLTPGDNPGQNSVGVTVQGSGGPEAELHRPGAEAGKVRPAPPPRGLLRLGL
jgi:RHS repeat-associated protein